MPLGGEGNLRSSGDKDAFQAPSVVESLLLEVPPLLLMFLNGGDWEKNAPTGHLVSAVVSISPPCLAHMVLSTGLPCDSGENESTRAALWC